MNTPSRTQEQEGPKVELRNLQDLPLPEEVLPAAVRQALALAEGSLDCVSVAVVDAERMARLNRAYLGREGPTDVIAFPAEDSEQGRCGEVILCAAVAAAQAEEGGHSLARELAILVAHGTLHTLGYRDDTPAGREQMRTWEEMAADRALSEVGLA